MSDTSNNDNTTGGSSRSFGRCIPSRSAIDYEFLLNPEPMEAHGTLNAKKRMFGQHPIEVQVALEAKWKTLDKSQQATLLKAHPVAVSKWARGKGDFPS